MKTTIGRWIASGILAALAGPALGLTNSWKCYSSPTPCFPGDPNAVRWDYADNWTLFGVPGPGQDVRVMSDPLLGGVGPVQYVQTSASLPVFAALQVDGLTLEHKNPADSLATHYLTLGGGILTFPPGSPPSFSPGGKYVFEGTTGAVTGTVSITLDAVIGAGGPNLASFEHNKSGTVSVGGDLILGKDAGSRGAYSMASGGGGTLTVAGKTVVGKAGEGTFDQNSGTHTTGTLVLGEVWQPAEPVGTYNLKGGTLTATGGQIVVGDAGTGVFNNKDGVSHSVTELVLGKQGSGKGTYELSGGGAVTSTNTTVGAAGAGIFTHGSGTHTTGTLLLGSQFGGQGSYTIGGAGSTLNVSGELGIGVGPRGAGGFPTLLQAAGAGSFTQSGGQVTVSGGFWQDSNNSLLVGGKDILRSVYRLEGGTLTLGYDTPTNWTASMSGNSLFEHKGGTLSQSAAGDFIIGHQYSASYDTKYTMTGTLTEANFFGLTVGGLGKGIFDQQAGTVNASLLVIGQGAAALSNDPSRTQGIYGLSGKAQLQVDYDVILGGGYSPVGGSSSSGTGGGSGTFTQTGGTVSVGLFGPTNARPITIGNLHLGVAGTVGGGTGVYNMTDGILTVSGRILVGDTEKAAPGYGEFHQSSGIVSAGAGIVDPGALTVSNGSYDLSGGELTVLGNVSVGRRGTLDVSGTGVLKAASINIDGKGTLNYSGGSITLGGTGTGTLTVAAAGVVNVSGSAANPTTFSGNVINNGGAFKIWGFDESDRVVWDGIFNNVAGAYETDPATNAFMSDLIIGSNGYLIGGLGDIFEMHKGFLNSSAQAAMWNTSDAELDFVGSGDHLFGVSGDGSSEIFAWSKIMAGAGVHLSFFDSTPGVPGMVLWLDVLALTDGLNAILLDPGELLTIHFDPNNPGNEWLVELGYTSGVLTLGSTLPPGVPEPSTLALLGLGLAGLAAARRRRH